MGLVVCSWPHSPALAQGPEAQATATSSEVSRPLHFGIVGGFQLNSADLDLMGYRTRPLQLDHGPVLGLRAGYRLSDPLGVELALSLVPVSSVDGLESGLILPVHADLVIDLTRTELRPFVAAGAGMQTLISDGMGNDTDFLLTLALGGRWRFAAERLGLRAEVRGTFSDAVEGVMAANVAFNLGVDVYTAVGGAAEAGPATRADADGDGVVDARDACPDLPGLAIYDGCPDTDGDGTPDPKDACPDSSGLPAFHGCPDTDGDGIPDTVDSCPTLSGIERFAGCPDSDDDGIPDGQDACPQLKGTPDRQGCPQPPDKVREMFSGVVEGVVFAPDKATLLPQSLAVLSRVADLLQQHPYLRVEVQSHTDDRGPKQRRYALSAERAQAVVSQLVKLGVDPRRLRAVGLGPDQPVASNRSKAGRAKNDRIELHLIED